MSYREFSRMLSRVIRLKILLVILTLCIGMTISSSPQALSQITSSKANPSAPRSVSGKSSGGRLSIDAMTAQAELIIVGKVSSTQTEWNKDTSRISTRATVVVDEYLKGTPSGKTITITTPGGEIGSVGELYSEAARFQKNEEVVVFASKDAHGNLRVVGGEQGKFIVSTDSATGKKLVASGTSLESITSQIKSSVKLQEQK